MNILLSKKKGQNQIKRIEANWNESIGIEESFAENQQFGRFSCSENGDVEDSKIEVMKNASDSVAIIKLNNEVLGGLQLKLTSDNLLGTLIKKRFFLLKMMNVGDILFPQIEWSIKILLFQIRPSKNQKRKKKKEKRQIE